ncbi:MAG: T9SS type A sorting domain-containing protein [Rhodothermales bacterium]|nr:T9SS type A sorting domain-containing protein [Rhodothermales bacterium]MBO6778052.1 T9SS type A sorting domain-containing protein [Rhodothermales bacterium]
MLRIPAVLAALTLTISATAQPVADLPGVSISKVTDIPDTDGQNPIRIEHNPADGKLYVLATSGRLYVLTELRFGWTPEEVLTQADHAVPSAVGMDFGADGTLYLIGNENVDSDRTRFVVRRGQVDGTGWNTVATSEPYLLSRTWFDHKANGMTLTPDGQSLLINSGARTDHGEMYGGVREEGLTAIVLKIPADATDLVLPNDRETLKTGGFVFAEGIRNSFDLEFAPNGDLMAADNAGDRDDAEEFNWIREGHHYGFPWRIGTSETPQQHAGYDPSADPFVQPDRNTNNVADTGWYFSNDPTYPAPPAGVTFTDPIANRGPFADLYRDTQTGEPRDASDMGTTVGSLTPHRSPLGLVFDADSLLDWPMRGGAFLVSWNTAEDQLLARLGGTGEDLLYLDLEKSGDTYTMSAERVAHGFDHPIDAVMVANTIYVLEYGEPWAPGGSRAVQAVTIATDLASEDTPVGGFHLDVYPNPAWDRVQVNWNSAAAATVEVVDVLGRSVLRQSVHGRSISLETGSLSRGVYFVRVQTGRTVTARPLLLR